MNKSLVGLSLILGVNANFNQLEETVRQMANSMGMRSLVGINAVKDFNGYGCWCYFTSPDDQTRTGIGYGKGEPVNEFDAACKVMHGGYECVVADRAAASEECEPWTVAFTQPTLSAVNSLGSFGACQAANGGVVSCASLACGVEKQFALDILAIGNSVPKELNVYQHSQGFNNIDNCPVQRGVRNPTTQCCGDYPNRFPFKTINGARKCCEVGDPGEKLGTTYNDAAWDCCNDGVGPNGCPGD